MADRITSPTAMPGCIARILSWFYRLGIGFQNWRFDRGIGVHDFDRPVISIGNLSAGGTGKTPMVHWIANELIKAGKHPAIAMRGYKAAPGEMGDEEREHRQALPGVPVVAQPDRVAGLRTLFEREPGVDCVVLDDGFQHRQIGRDLDIVLIDASRPPYQDALLPRGFLRDPVSSLARADVVVVTHREMVSDDEFDELAAWLRSKITCPIAVASHAWIALKVYTRTSQGWDESESCVGDLQAQRVLGVCAIGNPEGFFGQIKQAGGVLVDQIIFRDHDPLDRQTIEQIALHAKQAGVSMVCMTRKDWVKAQAKMGEVVDLQVVVPELGLVFESGEPEVRLRIDQIWP